MSGLFVSLEGPEGAGKSTVATVLAQRLREAGHTVCTTREPGAGPVGSKIRSILLDGGDVDRLCELFLFLADRAQHVATVVRPALERGETVLCDRHADSTLVYQGYARGFDVDALRRLNDLATDGLRPDLTLLLDLEPAEGLARLSSKDRLDAEPLDFHQKVRAGFLAEARREPGRWVVVDAAAPLPGVLEACWSAVARRLEDRHNAAKEHP